MPVAIGAIKRWDWRRILFTPIAGVVSFFLLTNLFRLAAPWGRLPGTHTMTLANYTAGTRRCGAR